jgi:hypothetical protein
VCGKGCVCVYVCACRNEAERRTDLNQPKQQKDVNISHRIGAVHGSAEMDKKKSTWNMRGNTHIRALLLLTCALGFVLYEQAQLSNGR